MDRHIAHHPPYEGCFGCRPGGPAGLRLVADTGGGADRMTVTFGAEWETAPGIVHPGVIAAAADEAIGRMVWDQGSRCATARLETDHLRPVPTGTALVVDAWTTGVEGRKVHTRAEVRRAGSQRGDQEALFLRAYALYIRLRPDA